MEKYKINENEIITLSSLEESLNNFANIDDECRDISDISNKIVNLMDEIRKSRDFLHYSQREFSDIVGLKQPQYARYESLQSIPRLDTFIKIADCLGLEVSLMPKYQKCKITNLQSTTYENALQNNELYITGRNAIA